MQNTSSAARRRLDPGLPAWPQLYFCVTAIFIRPKRRRYHSRHRAGCLRSCRARGDCSHRESGYQRRGRYNVEPKRLLLRPGSQRGQVHGHLQRSWPEEIRGAVTLANGQVLVLNPTLSVGDTSETVTVTGETIQLATYDSGTVNTQLDAARIDQLPMNGRNVLGLAQNTVPGVEANGTRANGLMQEGMEYSQDGAPMTNRNFGGEGNSAQATLPDPDSVQEARFETMNSSAQFATPATVILTTKSGTNDIHGSLFETARNNYFGIAKARQNPANFAAPHFVRNEFGGSVGGPIVIPKLYNGKNRSFLLCCL